MREDTNWASVSKRCRVCPTQLPDLKLYPMYSGLQLKAEVSYEMERLRMIAFTESEAVSSLHTLSFAP